MTACYGLCAMDSNFAYTYYMIIIRHKACINHPNSRAPLRERESVCVYVCGCEKRVWENGM